MTESAPNRRPATRVDVARLAGVSTAVVSYVINDGPRPVAPKTRAKVLRAIEALGYLPNANARALKRGTTGMLGLLVPEILNPYHSEFIDALDAAAARRDRMLLLAVTRLDPDREATLLRDLIERGVDGLLLLSHLHDERLYTAATGRTQQVLLDRSAPVPGFTAFGTDHVDGARRATEHLVAHGHERIALVCGPLQPSIVGLRVEGWQAALDEHGLVRIPPAITSWSRDGGYTAVEQLLRHPDPPTAILAGSDLIAIGVLRALRDRGIAVPDDMAVISYDGTPEANYATPRLTTLRQPFEDIADAAVASLVDQDSGPDHRLFPMEFLAGESCGCSASS
ncbi:LacI family DNA-binding transcriptional regulator [Tessaracoccus caeni]|uniref:LacI family DNA-binding transcriptional regulator n=1 Tax=Tessaracoccus caeni TaxID=3031239 RepID=UPI0023DAE563|nr:LacI family DNA-binding transcriptional regulator [Tessaracoccus caeni]MDF1489445.1 LacI family DNA-binding transcriptional regulator [Tessaracoccus caeni]